MSQDSSLYSASAARLLSSKLRTPALRPGLVSRPRLLELLDRGLEGRLILISAPAGFGKTTLMGSWLAARRQPAAWLSLDGEDNDPARFFRYLVAALQSAGAPLGEALPALLQSPQSPSVEALLALLVNELDRFPGQLVLVLDDYHLIVNPQIHRAVAFMLDRLPLFPSREEPCGVHLAILTRADPPLSLSRLRVRAEMVEVRAADLGFTLEEAALFLNKGMGLGLAAADVATLGARTEGWIAGLQLAALSLRGREDAAALIAAFGGSHRYVVDYLADEVLARQPDSLRSFMLQTSVLTRMSGPLCDALTGCGDGQRTLETLEQANMFLIPLDQERRWYRYHHLFADVLRSRLRQSDPDLERALLRRASEWHEAHGSAEEAMGYALAAGDHQRAAALAEALAPVMLSQGRVATLSAWIDALPGEVLAAHVELELSLVWSLFFELKVEQMTARVRRLEEHWAEGAPPVVEGEVVLLRGVLARLQGNIEGSVALLQRALELLPADRPLPRGRAWVHLGLAYTNVDLRRAEEALINARESFGAAASAHGMLAALHFLSAVLNLRGELPRAKETCAQALSLTAKTPYWPAASYAHAAMGEVLYEQDELDRAEEHLRRAAELAEMGGHAEVLVKALMALARLHRARGEWGEGQRSIDHLGEVTRQMPSASLPLHPVSDEQVRLWLAQGRMDEAARAVRGEDRPSAEIPALLRVVKQTTWARVVVACGRPQEALSLLADAVEQTTGIGAHRLTMQAHAVQALALRAEGHMDRALDALDRALTWAERGGYVRSLLDEGPAMGDLLALWVRRRAGDPRLAHVRRLLAALGAKSTGRLEEEPAPAVTAEWIEALSERELEVLRLVAEGRSNSEVAEALIIATGTVKKHLSNIFGKLGAKSRTECVARARELGLI